MKITKTNLPASSVLAKNHVTYNYTDSFKGQLAKSDETVTPTDVCKAFLSSVPGWANKLLTVRNKIVSLFGLKAAAETTDQRRLDNFTGKPGEQLTLLKVVERSDNEMVLAADDWHLNFKISLFLDRTTKRAPYLIISTIVEFNNWFGRLYFFFVKPVHRIIVPATVRATIKELARQKS